MSYSQSSFRKLPARYAAIVMPLLLSLLMTCIVSVISTLRGIGPDGFPQIWLSAWGLSWLVAFPVLLLVLPVVRRLTCWSCAPADAGLS
ncbi:hypothetical protein JHS3_29870 [Jeongeupia sp. HS-3]|uniref:DUF2798 domain-containing protein n=1 Tax=Jeongeupia sp. HS-3 TaxID=1009682 RepID=UPI0018A5C2C1|nr:DUF2798 domain-containing protein [Jeongeupia sp. HS-3]BCL77251.1 hypothetical protein JHS3_29870 [Jeongeupia sp. HS-3]